VTIRAALGVCIALGSTFAAGSARADNYVVYVHGRTQTSWDASALYPIQGFAPAIVHYDATEATLAQANVDVRAQLASYCSGENVCIVVAYSNGALQVGYTQAYYPEALENALYVEAGGSAAGGTELLNGFTSAAGKVLGATYPNGVDATLSVSGARNAYNHDLSAGLVTYHLGGNTTWRNALWYATAVLLPGDDDGVVPFASAFGCASSGSQSENCVKYTGHRLELDAVSGGLRCNGGVCGSVDHFGIDSRAAYWAL
jgi:pimeloyl-ACP methyl ester carboxylesterase